MAASILRSLHGLSHLLFGIALGGTDSYIYFIHRKGKAERGQVT